MKVKIGNRIYNSEETAILLMMSDKEKEAIAKMPRDQNLFCITRWNPLVETQLAHQVRVQKWMSEIPPFSKRGVDVPTK